MTNISFDFQIPRLNSFPELASNDEQNSPSINGRKVRSHTVEEHSMPTERSKVDVLMRMVDGLVKHPSSRLMDHILNDFRGILPRINEYFDPKVNTFSLQAMELLLGSMKESDQLLRVSL
ncbi:MAG: hypothetical protein ACI9S8_000462 [Chlamydiales bacterium]|jgi:hypothetical protein